MNIRLIESNIEKDPIKNMGLRDFSLGPLKNMGHRNLKDRYSYLNAI